MSKEYYKQKQAVKRMITHPEALEKSILKTLGIISRLVGSTLGPHGKTVIIERQEANLPPYTSKDGITVYNAMSFSDEIEQLVLEVARESSSRTNIEAGDATTSATILSEIITRLGFEELRSNQRLSPQILTRHIEKLLNDKILPFIESVSIKIDMSNEEEATSLLSKVAAIATNNDQEMADAVMRAFEIVGSGGNIAVQETSGTSGFIVEQEDGYHIDRGFEDSGGKFFDSFINDRSNYRTVLDRPQFVLYNGKLNNFADLMTIVSQLAVAVHKEAILASGDAIYDDAAKSLAATGWDFTKTTPSPNIVIVAHGFSDSVLASMSSNFSSDKRGSTAVNLFPMVTAFKNQSNSNINFLQDLSAFIGVPIYDPVQNKLKDAQLKDIYSPGMERFESKRFRSVIYGTPDESIVLLRAEELQSQLKNADSSYDAEFLKERIGLLTGGIATIKVVGSSEAELKEKRHRVDDAVSAVRGAVDHGVLPGAGKTLLFLSEVLKRSANEADNEALKVASGILATAFQGPLNRLLDNAGYLDDEKQNILNTLVSEDIDFWATLNLLTEESGDAIDIGVVDSAAAVKAALKNSISVAKMLMITSGAIAFNRNLTEEVSRGAEIDEEDMAWREAMEFQNREKFDQQ